MKKNFIVVSIVIISALILLVGSLLLFFPSKPMGYVVFETVKVGYQPQVIHIPSIVALENKYFEEQGLKTEAIEFQSSNLLFNALIKGEVDVACINFFVLFAAEQTSPNQFKIYRVNYLTPSSPTLYFLVKKDSKINSLSELEGKKFGLREGSIPKFLTTLILEKFIDTKKVEFVIMKDELLLQALESGQIDVIYALEPLATVGLERGVAKILEVEPDRYIMEPFPNGGVVFSTKFLEENPETAQKIMKAMDKAIIFIAENEDKAKESLSKYTNIEPEIVQKVHFSPYWKKGEERKDLIQKLADLLYENKVLEKRLDVDKMLMK